VIADMALLLDVVTATALAAVLLADLELLPPHADNNVANATTLTK